MRMRWGALLLSLGAVLSTTSAATSAAGERPEGSDSPPARFLLGGKLGSFRTVSLDARGHTLRAAEGDGSTSALSVCPGSDAFAELATGVADDRWWKLAVAVRDVDTLELRTEHRFTSFERTDGPDSIAPIDIECLDHNGEAVAVYGRRGDAATITRLVGDDEDVIFRSRASTVELENGRAFVAQDTALREIDLRSGRVRHVGTIHPGTVSMDVSPDRKHVVFSSFGGGDVTKAGHWMLDVDARRIERFRTRLEGYSWIDDRTFAVFGTDDLVRVIDTRLRKTAQWTGWTEQDGVVRDGVVYGAGSGAVVSARVRTGPVKTLRLYDTSKTFAFEVVPPQPPPTPTPVPTSEPTPSTTASPEPEPSMVASSAPTSRPLALPDEPVSARPGPSTVLGAVGVGLAAVAAVGLLRRRRPAR